LGFLSQVLVSGITLGSLYALVGLGFVVIYRATKVVNFAQGEMMMLGAMLALYLYSALHLSYFLAFLLAVLLSGAFGAALERIAYRPLLDAPVVTLILATVAVARRPFASCAARKSAASRRSCRRTPSTSPAFR
jgi:branched-chain amino acid transport system permease protein